MRRRTPAPLLLLLALSGRPFAWPTTLADDANSLSPGEVARIGRPATALVVVKGFVSSGEGSAFCVRSDGMFVTNHHVIQHAKLWHFNEVTQTYQLRDEGKISLVLNSGRDDQKVVTARIVRSDPDWDLALLKAEGVENFPSLSVAPEDRLAATQDVVALGFPLGSTLAVQGGTYPSANVNKGRVRATKKDGDAPSVIEADLAINPGNSGGPLLDNRGQVVGVIHARVEQAGTPGFSLAVPVNRLESFLSQPEIAFQPPRVTRDGAEKPVEFKATLASEFAPREQPSMELVLGGWGKSARHYPMSLSNGYYRVEAPLFAGTNRPRAVKVTIGTQVPAQPLGVAWVEDCTLSGEFKTGRLLKPSSGPSHRLVEEKKEEEFQLGSAKKFRCSPRMTQAYFQDPRRDGNPVKGMEGVLAAIKDQQPSFLLGEHAKVLSVNEVTDDETVICSVVARRSGRIVARISVPMAADPAEGATLKAVSEARFLQPRHSPSRVNSFRVFIPKDDPAARVEYTVHGPRAKSQGGQGASSAVVKADDRKNAAAPAPGDPTGPGRVYQYDDVTQKVKTAQLDQFPQQHSLYGKRKGMRISGIGPLETSILLLLADSDDLKVGEYEIQSPETFDPRFVLPAATHLQLTSLSSPAAPDGGYSGRFRIWEFEEVGGWPRLAVDFVLYRKPDQPGGEPRPSIGGMIRINSRFE